MTSLLARFGQIEARLASSTSRWTAPRKRRRGDWFCRECQARATLPYRRTYSDDALRPSASTLIMPIPIPSEQATPPEQGAGVEASEASESGSATFAWGFKESDSVDESFWDKACRDAGAPSRAEIEVQDEEQAGLVYQPFELGQMAGPEGTQDLITRRKHQQVLSNIENEMLNIDYATLLPQALQHSAPDMTLRCILAASHAGDVEFLKAIDCRQFVSIIKTVRLADFTTKLLSVHEELSAHRQALMNVAPLPKAVFDLSYMLRAVVQIREKAGVCTEFDVYRSLLAAASDLGLRSWATQLWKDMQKDGHTPDLHCYNHYMASIVDNRKHHPLSQENKRVTTFHMDLRGSGSAGPKFNDYTVGPGGLKDRVMTVFGQLLKSGVRPDTESFCLLITAAAREGDTKTVHSLIQRAFGVDVDAVMQGESSTPHNSGTADDYLIPGRRFLYTIAHAYGINNDIPRALYLVDFFSQKYSISIDSSVWDELFEWTFVLAKRRGGELNRTSGATEGSLPLKSVTSLWGTMTSPPYLVKPEMRIYDLLIRNLAERDHPRAILENMREAIKQVSGSRRRQNRAFEKLSNALEHESDRLQRGDDGVSTQIEQCRLEVLRRNWELADIVRERDRGYFAKWLRLLLRATNGLARVDRQGEWTLRELPKFLWDWRVFAGRHVEYETIGGIVSFDIHDEVDMMQNREREHEKRGRMAEALKKVPVVLGEDWAGRVSTGTGRVHRKPHRPEQNTQFSGAQESSEDLV